MSVLAALPAVAGESKPRAGVDEKLAWIIEKNTGALGGDEKLDQFQCVVMLRNESMITVMKKPYYSKIELFRADTLRFAEGYCQDYAWEQWVGKGDTNRHKVEGRPKEALWHALQWPTNIYALRDMESLGHKLTLLGSETIDSVAYFVLQLTLSDGFQRQFLVNENTFLIERSRDYRRFHATDDKAQNIEVILSDFRKVDTYWFPFAMIERNVDRDSVLSRGSLLGVWVNEKIWDEEFSVETRSDYGFIKRYRDRLKK